MSKSAWGLVSRASPVHTATRNCTGDEGGPFGFGNQVLISSHRKLLRSKSCGGERCGNAGTRIRQAPSREASASEPLQKCRKRIRRCQNRGVTLLRDQLGGCLRLPEPKLGPHHEVDQALTIRRDRRHHAIKWVPVSPYSVKPSRT